jgi:pimeloyl-ACP methyl ester carboxylesterase
MNPKEFVSQRKTVTTPFGEIAYVEKGRGPAALFVHGVLLNSYLWREIIDRLADERRCIALDLMGHGATRVPEDQDLSLAAQARMLAAFVEALGLGPVDLVGNDSGGAVAQIYAADHPERIRTLTLTNCDAHDNVFPPPFVPLVELIKAGGMLGAFRPLLGNPEAARQAFASAFEAPEAVSAETLDAYVGPAIANEESGRCSQRWMQALKAEDLSRVTPKLRGLRAPTLIVWGTADVFFDVRWAHWLKDTIPGATAVIEVPGAKLFFPEERPDLLAGHLRRFWTSPTPAAAVA